MMALKNLHDAENMLVAWKDILEWPIMFCPRIFYFLFYQINPFTTCPIIKIQNATIQGSLGKKEYIKGIEVH